jgi:hypothetical protein
MTTLNIDEVTAFILTKATTEDLTDLVDAIKMRRQNLTKKTVRSLNVGDTVKFTGRAGVDVTGTVSSVKIKNVIVKTPTGNWRVPASMLTVVSKA